MNLEDLACHLYENYCQAVGGKAFNGDPLPRWAEFRCDPAKQKQSDAWITVAHQAKMAIAGAILDRLLRSQR